MICDPFEFGDEFENIGLSLRSACMNGETERLKGIIETSKYDLKSPHPRLQDHIDLAISMACVNQHHETIKEIIKGSVLSQHGLRMAKFHAKNDEVTLYILARCTQTTY